MFKFFDLGDGLWVKLGMTAKLGDRFIPGVKYWIQENGKPMPLLLNTAVTNSPEVKVLEPDGFAARLFLQDGGVKGFSSSKEILVTFQKNGHSRKFHARFDKEVDGDRSFYKFKVWEERPHEEKKEVFNPTMADAVKFALSRENHRNGNSDKQRHQPEEEKSRGFRRARRNQGKPEKKLLKQYLTEIDEAQQVIH